MRKWVRFAVIFAALASADSALADTPPAVYSDFAEDGVLSCGHSRSALKGVLNDASIHQYGDPLTLIGLKLAVRKQLAGGCRRTEQSRALESEGSPAAAPQSDDTTKSSGAKTKKPPKKKERSLSESKGRSAAGATAGVQQDGWMILVGVALLLLTLGSGGWAARRAFTDQR